MKIFPFGQIQIKSTIIVRFDTMLRQKVRYECVVIVWKIFFFVNSTIVGKNLYIIL